MDTNNLAVDALKIKAIKRYEQFLKSVKKANKLSELMNIIGNLPEIKKQGI